MQVQIHDPDNNMTAGDRVVMVTALLVAGAICIAPFALIGFLVWVAASK